MFFPGDKEFLEKEYKKYIERADKVFKDKDEILYKGKYLIKRLNYEEFVDKFFTFKEIEHSLEEIIKRGSTLSDTVYEIYVELATTLLIEPKQFI